MRIIDGFPMPVCRFARAYRCKILAEDAAYGCDEMVKQTFYGLRGYLRIAWPGVIVACELAPANVHDTVVAEEITEGAIGFRLGDRNYWSPRLFQALRRQGKQRIIRKKKGASPHFGTLSRADVNTPAKTPFMIETWRGAK